MWLYLVGAVAILWIVKWYRSLFKGFENVDKMFPGPSTIPILGNALELIGDTAYLCEVGFRQCNLYQRSFRVWLLNRLIIVMLKPSEVEAVLNNSIHLKKSEIYDFIIPWIGRGLLTSYGDKWKKNRKLLTPAFHFKILESFLDIFNANGDILCDKLETRVGRSGFNIMNDVKLYALDNISETAMGVKINAQMNPDTDLTRSIKIMCNITMRRVLEPWLRFNFIFKLTKLGQQQDSVLNVLHSFTRNVIDKRIEQRRMKKEMECKEVNEEDVGAKKKQAFLDILLDVYDDGNLTLDELKEEVDTFMFEGHDTVTSALSFTLYNLAYHPQYQELAYAEQQEIYGDDERWPTTEEISKMKYLEMIIKETLRLTPSVPLIGRYLEQDLRINEHTVVPKGSQIAIPTIAIHRNPEIWERPLEFYPDHFLPEVSAKRHPYAYIPFSAGARNCIGMKFAMMEMKAALSKVIRKFRVSPSQPPVDLQLQVETTLQSKTGILISITRRKPL